jgi:hypothetical protein
MSSSKTNTKINHTCNMSMLTETSTNSALASGRWVVPDEYARPIRRCQR